MAVDPQEIEEREPPTPDDVEKFDAAIGDLVRPVGAWDIPPGDNRARNGWIAKHRDELRARAAEIAVDMETGQHEGWRVGTPYSRHAIAVVMGFSAKNFQVLSFMAGHDFTRAVAWERTKRELNYHASITEIRPIAVMTYTANLIELCRRAYETPGAIKNAELLESVKVLARVIGGETPEKTKDVRQTINVFYQNIEMLPPAAREKALGLFQNNLRDLVRIAERSVVEKKVAS